MAAGNIVCGSLRKSAEVATTCNPYMFHPLQLPEFAPGATPRGFTGCNFQRLPEETSSREFFKKSLEETGAGRPPLRSGRPRPQHGEAGR